MEELFYKFRWQISIFLVGIIFVGGGIFLANSPRESLNNIEILEDAQGGDQEQIVVEVSGEVESSGVYELKSGSRVQDALDLAGGLTKEADGAWVEKTLNRASVLSDGQKIYIPKKDGDRGVLGQSSNLVNINTALANELESLAGIGPKTAQKIIEQRPYSFVEDLLKSGVLSEKVYENNKEKLSVY